MSDDAQAKQTLMTLNQTGKISDHTLLDEFGLDVVKEQASLDGSRKDFRKGLLEDAVAQAKSQGEAQVIAAQYQARAQQAMEEETTKIDTELFHDELSQESLGIPEDANKIIEKYSREIFLLDPERQSVYLQELYNLMPTTASLVHRRLQQLQGIEGTVSGILSPQHMEAATQAPPQAKAKSEDQGKGPSQGEV